MTPWLTPATSVRVAMFPCSLRSVLLACAALATAGCSTHNSPQQELPSREVSAGPSLRNTQYKLQPGDLLTLTFAGEPDYNQQVRVDWDGHISLAYLAHDGHSEMQAAGLTVSALAGRIAAYAKENEVLVNPKVQVLVAEYSGQTFVLLGQVTQPGRYAFPRGQQPRLELLDAIALGGGYTRLARQSEVLVKRGAKVYKVDLRKLATVSGTPGFRVLPGDVITVTERLF